MPAAQRISIVAALVTAGLSLQAHAALVCPNDKAALEKYAGEYSSTRFLATLAKERSISRTIEIEDQTKPAQAYNVLVTSEELYTGRTWHEPDAVIEDCVTVDGKTLRLKGNPQDYVRVNENHSDYFSALFSGCFKDETGAPWCFTPNAITIGAKTQAATLLMDRFNLPAENVVRSGDDVWFFRPVSNGGWNIFTGTWIADDEAWQIDWTKPWRKLTPASKAN